MQDRTAVGINLLIISSNLISPTKLRYYSACFLIIGYAKTSTEKNIVIECQSVEKKLNYVSINFYYTRNNFDHRFLLFLILHESNLSCNPYNMV